MSTLKTHNLQSPDASSVNIAMAPNAGIIVTGISTFNSDIKLSDSKKIHFGDGSDLQIYHGSNVSHIAENGTGPLRLSTDEFQVMNSAQNKTMIYAAQNLAVSLNFNGNTKIQTTNTGAVVTGILTATSFSGDGSNLTNLPPSAPVGGSASNKVFFENDKVVSVNYQITSTKNAMTAGPVTINSGIGVTVPSGCAWTIV